MKSDKKILAFVFTISIIGLLTESLAVFDVETKNIFSEIIRWMNYISPPIDLSFSKQIVFNIPLKEFNLKSSTFLNYLNIIFYVTLFLSGIIYWLSKGKEAKIVKLCFAIFLLQAALLIVFIIPVNLTYYEHIKSNPYLWPRTIYFMINRALWFYLIYQAIQSLTINRELTASSDNNKLNLLHLNDTPKHQRFAHVFIDSILCLIICPLVFNSLITENGLAVMHDLIGRQVTTYTIFFLCTFIYYVFYEVLLGFTPAKILTDSRVIMIHGGKISFGTGLLRTLSRNVPFEGVAFLLGPNCPHDYWTDTRVIKEKQPAVKSYLGLWIFSIAVIIAIASYYGNKFHKQKAFENLFLRGHEIATIDIENHLAHLDTSTVFQLENVNNRYNNDSTNFLKVEAVHGDSIECSLFKYKEDRTTYEMEREYILAEKKFPQITVYKSVLKNLYKPEYDKYGEDALQGKAFLNDGEKYRIEKIRWFFGPEIEYFPGSGFYSEEYGVEMRLFNMGSAATLIGIKNIEGDLKWEQSFPKFVNAMEISGNLKLAVTNFKLKGKYKSVLTVEGMNGVQQKYMIEIHNSTTYVYRIFE